MSSGDCSAMSLRSIVMNPNTAFVERPSGPVSPRDIPVDEKSGGAGEA